MATPPRPAIVVILLFMLGFLIAALPPLLFPPSAAPTPTPLPTLAAAAPTVSRTPTAAPTAAPTAMPTLPPTQTSSPTQPPTAAASPTVPALLPDAAAAPFMGVLFAEDFESLLPQTIIPGDWRLLREGTHGMLCISNYHSRYGEYPKFLFGDPGWKQYSVEVDMRVIAEEPGHIALLTRLNDRWWGYRHGLTYGPWGARLGQYYYGGVDGKNTQGFARTSLPTLTEDWYLMRAEVDGDTARTLLDGELTIDYNLRLSGQGFAGMEVGPGAFVCVDNLVVRSLNRTPEALAAASWGIITQGANLRLRAGLQHRRIGTVVEGERVFVLDRTQHWVYVRKRFSSIQGWVWATAVNVG